MSITYNDVINFHNYLKNSTDKEILADFFKTVITPKICYCTENIYYKGSIEKFDKEKFFKLINKFDLKHLILDKEKGILFFETDKDNLSLFKNNYDKYTVMTLGLKIPELLADRLTRYKIVNLDSFKTLFDKDVCITSLIFGKVKYSTATTLYKMMVKTKKELVYLIEYRLFAFLDKQQIESLSGKIEYLLIEKRFKELNKFTEFFHKNLYKYTQYSVVILKEVYYVLQN